MGGRGSTANKAIRAPDEQDKTSNNGKTINQHSNRQILFRAGEGYAIEQIKGKHYLALVAYSRGRTEVLRHMDVLPFSVAGKPQKMKKKIKSNFIFFVL